MMMFRWNNKQPGIKKKCGHHHDIYNCISPLIKRLGLPLFYSNNTAVFGEKLVRLIWSFVYFHFFEALNGTLEMQFLVSASFLHLIKDIDSIFEGHAGQIFKAKTLLNNAFKIYILYWLIQ